MVNVDQIIRQAQVYYSATDSFGAFLSDERAVNRIEAEKKRLVDLIEQYGQEQFFGGR